MHLGPWDEDTRTTPKLVIQLGGFGGRPLYLESGDLGDIINCPVGSSDIC